MDIDCSPACPIFIRVLNSCPTKHIDGLNDLFELFMVILSVSPFVISFIFILSALYYRTTRGVLIVMMIFAQNFIVDIIKGSLRDPRPNFKCNQQFGNPSNHATFFTSLIVWVIAENLTLFKKNRFASLPLKVMLFVAYPFILYSRLYLKYHSAEQIFNGILLGIFIGTSWFFIVTGYILKKDNDNHLKGIFSKLRLNNNLTDHDLALNESNPQIFNKIIQLGKKQEELSKIKSQLSEFRESVESSEFAKNPNKNKSE